MDEDFIHYGNRWSLLIFIFSFKCRQFKLTSILSDVSDIDKDLKPHRINRSASHVHSTELFSWIFTASQTFDTFDAYRQSDRYLKDRFRVEHHF